MAPMRNNGRERNARRLPELIHAKLVYRIVGVFYSAHRDMGEGFLESVYNNALAIGLQDAGLSFEREVSLEVKFRGQVVGQFRADFLVESAVLLEVKAAPSIQDRHCAQVINYLRCTNVELGLLLCFGERAQFRRFVFENARKQR